MNKSRKTQFFKIIMLVSAVMLMMLLCGCRTRISNNTEVTPTLSDEGGWISDTYQVRRDELGIPVAEAPLFTLPGSEEEATDEEYYEDYEEYDDSEEYDESEEEMYDEEETDDGSSTSTTTPSRRTTTTPSHHVTVRPSTRTTVVSVKLDVNGKGAKCSRSTIAVKKGSTYGSLPTPTRSGYTFEGWYTAKSKGAKITTKTKVTTDKTHTLYAHWKETKKKSFTITFDGNGDDDEVELSATQITVTEGGTYGNLPTAKRNKYKFKGWYTDPEGGSQIKSSTKFTANKKQTLYAHWSSDKYKWWKDEFEKDANGITPEMQVECFVVDDKGNADGYLDDCRVLKAADAETATTIIKFIKNDAVAEEEYEKIKAEYAETAPDATIIIASNDAIYNKDKAIKLVYRIKLLNAVYGCSFDADEAEYELLDGGTVTWYPEE
jgi:uncharacterized repeat protein (TIGR02543 family)